MRVGIVGLGLIGGSIAKRLYNESNIMVLGWDNDPLTLQYAQMVHKLDMILDIGNIRFCDVIIMATYPHGIPEYLNHMGSLITPGTIVIDCSGIKREICSECNEIAKKYGFIFVGGHPMAGTQFSGFKNSKEDMFEGATMVIVPPEDHADDVEMMDMINTLFKKNLGFARVSVTSAETHDEIIAFTSQMAHIVSNAFIKSPTACRHEGFSAGSYKDLTRVAALNAPMWTELFMANRDNLIKELDVFIEHLSEYREAMKQEDPYELCRLLKEGSELKREVDGIE